MAASSHGRLATMASSDDDEAEIELYHHSEYSDAYAVHAIFRALARPASSLLERTLSWDASLALSQGRLEVRKWRRFSELLSVKDRIAREYLVARRLSADPTVGRIWAQTWARLQHPERCHSLQAEANFLCQKYQICHALDLKFVRVGRGQMDTERNGWQV